MGLSCHCEVFPPFLLWTRDTINGAARFKPLQPIFIFFLSFCVFFLYNRFSFFFLSFRVFFLSFYVFQTPILLSVRSLLPFFVSYNFSTKIKLKCWTIVCWGIMMAEEGCFSVEIFWNNIFQLLFLIRWMQSLWKSNGHLFCFEM